MTADPRAVEIASAALCLWRDHADCALRNRHHPDAIKVLDALTAAGWSLLPPGGQTRELRARILDIADQITEHPDDHGWTWSSLAEDLREAATPTEEAPSE